MNWADFYLFCFIVGFAFSLISVLGGFLHLPHGHHGHLHIGHGSHSGGSFRASPFNPSTIAAFLVWFGGVGYLLARFSGLWLVFALLIAAGAGILAGSAVFLFFAKVLLADEKPLDPADYDMIGVLGQVTSRIRESGIGEISFSQAGRAAARRRGATMEAQSTKTLKWSSHGTTKELHMSAGGTI